MGKGDDASSFPVLFVSSFYHRVKNKLNYTLNAFNYFKKRLRGGKKKTKDTKRRKTNRRNLWEGGGPLFLGLHEHKNGLMVIFVDLPVKLFIN